MILTSLPDLPPRPETNVNAAFRRSFYARWGKENCVICGQSTGVEYATMTQALSIKTAWGGRERYRLQNREVGVDDESYLILNEGSVYGSSIKVPAPMWTFALFMRPGLHREVYAARCASAESALDDVEFPTGPVGFSEHLHRHDGLVTPRLKFIREAILSGERSEEWLEEQLLQLVDAMFRADRTAARRAGSLDRAKPSTRRELARRLRLAADYMSTCYDEPVDLSTTARMACLSRFHLVRYFPSLYDTTPHVFLRQTRARAARRLIERGERDAHIIVAQSGFGSRSSLRRALALHP